MFKFQKLKIKFIYYFINKYEKAANNQLRGNK